MVYRFSKRIATVLIALLGMSTSSVIDVRNVRGAGLPSRGAKLHHIVNERKKRQVLCRITKIHTSYIDGEAPESDTDEFYCVPVVDEQYSESIFPLHIPRDFIARHINKIYTGTMLVTVSDAKLSEAGVEVSDSSEFRATHQVPNNLRHLVKTTSTTGIRTIAVIRLSTEDSTPTYTLDQLKNLIYEGNITLFKQFKDCSFGQLIYVPSTTGFMDFKIQGKFMSNFTSAKALVDEAQKQLAARYKSPSLIAETVVMCLPPGTPGNWVGSAPLNHWRAIFNDKWCVSLSALMHELGHLMGLLHAGRDGNPYADAVGYMSWGFPSATYPRKCYNGEKSWDLGWYKDRHLTLTAQSLLSLENNATLVNLAAFTDYNKTDASKEAVIISLDGSLFLMYNRAESFNIETLEKRDEVTINKRLPDRSDSLAGLTAGSLFNISKYNGTDKMLFIKACNRTDNTKKADFMTISIGLDMILC